MWSSDSTTIFSGVGVSSSIGVGEGVTIPVDDALGEGELVTVWAGWQAEMVIIRVSASMIVLFMGSLPECSLVAGVWEL